MAAVVSLDAALRDARLFRGGRALLDRRDGLPTGIAALDAALPWGGFPRGALTELLHGRDGLGELDLLLPALHRLTADDARVALIAPPYLPYAPALLQAGLPLSRLAWIAAPPERTLWAAEQCLRAGCLGGVLLWSPTGDDRALRRLQLAAEQGGAQAWLFRPLKHALNASPAALRLRVARGQVDVLKCRGAVLRGAFARDGGDTAATAAAHPLVDTTTAARRPAIASALRRLEPTSAAMAAPAGGTSALARGESAAAAGTGAAAAALRHPVNAAGLRRPEPMIAAPAAPAGGAAGRSRGQSAAAADPAAAAAALRRPADTATPIAASRPVAVAAAPRQPKPSLAARAAPTLSVPLQPSLFPPAPAAP